MSMISEQIKELREKAQVFEDSGCATNGIVKTFRKAADTIEELSAKLADVNMERSTAYYNNGWIPCSERLPKQYERVLVTATVMQTIFLKESKVAVDVGYLITEGVNEFILSTANTRQYAIAWMPLPEPYKGVE